MKISRSILQALLLFVLGASPGYADGDEDVLKHPGVIADRKGNTVVVDAVATGLRAQEAAEFVLINSKSGHDYEAIAQTEALPSHIREALLFIGIQPGSPIGRGAMQFWSRGEEVEILLRCSGEDGRAENEVGIGDILFDLRSNSPLQTNNFVFAGSFYAEKPADEGEQVLVADVYEPHSIIATFTMPATLLTVPWHASQGEAFGNIVLNPEYVFDKGHPLKFIFKSTGNPRSEINLTLDVKTEGKGEHKRDSYVLRSYTGEQLNKASSLVGVLSEFGHLVDDGRKPYVSVSFDHRMEIARIRRICAFLHSIANEKGITIKPPPQGQLYYKAFLPDPVLYDRSRRGQQPPELHLEKKDGEISALLKQAEIEWDGDGSGESEVRLETREMEGPPDFASKLNSLESATPVLLVYVSEKFTLAEIMRYVRPVLESHPAIFVLAGEL